ncbi:4-coumarate--CoA ligase-like 3 [Diachasma alloeum]|uniref:4-coumarate--CoA ligase-like 3 n=1 Tax=Diachasma alloeum TaxID=454923 RepID=UPI00073844AC|nr:4-coumarate--CoA ligase-like 3 [Diachasma alloeum]
MMNTVSKKYPQLSFEDGIWKGPTKIYRDDDFQVGKRVLQSLKEAPNFIAQLDSATGKLDTFGEMMDRSIRCALWLRKKGIGRGDVISVAGDNHQNTVIPILAGLFTGCIINTYSQDWLDEELISDFVRDLEPKIVFADTVLAPRMMKYSNVDNKKFEVIVFENLPGFTFFKDILDEQSAVEVDSFECVDIPSEEDTAFLLFTSGSSGNPKVFRYPYKLLKRDVHWLPREELYERVGIWCTEPVWVVVIISALGAIINRSTYVIHKYANAADFCRVVEKYKINWMMLGTEHVNMISRLSNTAEFDFSEVTFIRYCGSYIRPEVERNLHTIFPRTWLSQSYGLTEIGVVTYAMSDHKCPSCGIPAENTEIKLINSKDEIVMCPNQSGELCARTPCLSIAYHKKATASERTLDSEGWYRTGDLAYYNEDGEFFFVDRIKEMIRYIVADIPAGVVEDCILKHPSVLEVAVVAKLHEEDIEHPMAFIVKKPYIQVTEEEIEGWVEKHLPDRMRLRAGVKFLEDMPYNNAGKIAKGVLRRWCNAE